MCEHMCEYMCEYTCEYMPYVEVRRQCRNQLSFHHVGHEAGTLVVREVRALILLAAPLLLGSSPAA